MHFAISLVWLCICLIIVILSENPKWKIKIIPERQSINTDLTSLMVFLLNADATPVEVECSFSCNPLVFIEESAQTTVTPIETTSKKVDKYFDQPVEADISERELNSTAGTENTKLEKAKREVHSNQDKMQNADDIEGAILIMGAGGIRDKELMETLNETLETKGVTKSDGGEHTISVLSGEDRTEITGPKESKCPEISWHLEPGKFSLTASVMYQTLNLTRSKFPAVPSTEKLNVVCKSVKPELQAYAEILSTFEPSPFLNETALSMSERNISASCPCDLLLNSCDEGCCCDENCLIEGCHEDFIKPLLKEYHCDQAISIASPFLCIEYINSPYLGMHYPNRADPITNITRLNELKLKHKKYSYEEQQLISVPYSVGDPVIYPNDILTLPAELYSGMCVQLSPVRFLTDSSSSCTTRLIKENCSKTSLFNANFYIQNCNSQDCPFYKADKVNIISVNVTYKCAENFQLNSFHSVEEEDAFTNLSACEIAQPYYNDTTNICSNVVFKVHYNIFWRDSVIESVNATIIFGNVKLMPEIKNRMEQKEHRPSLAAKVTQHFSATFKHFKISSKENITKSSGNPGYQFGMPVLLINGTAISLQHPGEKSLCSSDPPLLWLLFAQNVQMSCETSLEPFENSTDLNQMLSNRHLDLFPIEVSSLGNPNKRKIPVTVLSDPIPDSDELLTIMNVEILYTQVCQSSPESYQLLGISVSYTASPEVACISNLDPSCGTLNEYPLTSVVVTTNIRFIPAVIELREPIKRYWFYMREDDISWSQLFYPFSHYNEYGEVSLFTSQCCLLFIIIGVSLIYLTKGNW